MPKRARNVDVSVENNIMEEDDMSSNHPRNYVTDAGCDKFTTGPISREMDLDVG